MTFATLVVRLNSWRKVLSPNNSFRLQQWLQPLPHRLSDDLLPSGSRMDLIRLVETSIAAHALGQKRDEHCSILRRQIGEDLLELAGVIRTEIRRDPHSSDHDSSERASRSYFVDDGQSVEIISRISSCLISSRTRK